MEVKESDEVEELTLCSSKKKKKEGKILGKRKAKPVEDGEEKNPFLHLFKETCGNINARVVSERTTNLVDKSNTPTMAEVLNLMVECGAVEGTPLFHTATKIVMKPAYRELFMLIKNQGGPV